MRKNKKGGIIYLIKYDKQNCYKIGMSRNLIKRLRKLEESCPFYIILLFWAYVLNPNDVEQDLHSFYSDKRIKGEWYRLKKEDVERIKNRLKGVTKHYMRFGV